MRLLFVTSLEYLPQSHGGMQSSTNELCICLRRRGHEVSVLSALHANRWNPRIRMQINKRRFGCKMYRDSVSGYSVWRTRLPSDALEYVVGKESPALIVVIVADEPMRIATAALRMQIPLLLRLLDVEFHSHAGRFEDLGAIPCVANSRFTAGRYRSRFGVTPGVIYPFISTERYRTKTTRENVTFVNPHPYKGLDIALGIAALCPEIPFTFVESWRLSADQWQSLRRKRAALPNLTLLRAQDDMRTVYGKCKILLAPSVWEEAYGRVASEAQISGIPVVASSRGGLPEAVGPGGILLDPEQPISAWAAAIRRLWQDGRQYAELSAAAAAHAERREMTLDYQIDAWERAMLAACGYTSQRARHQSGGK